MPLTRRNPITDLAGHLLWTRTGTVWATWRTSGLTYNGTIGDKRAVAGLHRLLVRALSGEALLFSAMLAQDAVSVVERMIDGLDLTQVPAWVDECDATLDALDQVAMGERAFWLSVPLANTGKRQVLAPARAAWRGLQDRLDLPITRPSRDELNARLLQAGQIQDLIPAPFRPTPVTPAEHVWIANHPQRRGQMDLPVPQGQDTSTALLTPSSQALLSEPILDEGATTDDAPAHRMNVMAQRVLKVIDSAGADIHDFGPSYQCLLAVAETPAGGMRFPGSEWLFALDQSGIDVDWAIRMRTNPREKVLARNRKAVRQLNEQFDHREAETTTGLHDLNLAADMLAEYEALFANDKLEVEVEHTMILAVAAARTHPSQSDAEVNAAAQDQAIALAKLMHDTAGLKLERIPGHQEELWWAMQPGSPRTPLIKTYAHFTTSDNFAKLVPFITPRLGGRRGPALFRTLSTSRSKIGHIDLGGYPELDMSGSVLFVGETGSGKSVGQKTICSHLVSQGGQFWAIDKSDDGEWAVFARSFTSHLVVDPADPTVSMDPLRTLGLEDGSSVVRSFLVQLLNIDTQGPQGLLLSHIFETGYLLEHNLASTPQVIDHLATLSPKDMVWAEGADQLASRLRGWANNAIARVVFDPALPPADLTVDATAWRTQGMEQPNADELLHDHLFRQLAVEKIFGRAYYHLLTGLARRLCFADRSRPTAFVNDEAYDILQNPENIRECQHFLRQGRRPKALWVAGTHDVGDLKDEVLTGLIPTRVLMRHRDDTLARRGLHWLGIDKEDPDFADYLERVTTDMSPVKGDDGVPPERRGEAYVRDAFGTFDFCQLLPPALPSRRAAALTTPPKARVRG